MFRLGGDNRGVGFSPSCQFARGAAAAATLLLATTVPSGCSRHRPDALFIDPALLTLVPPGVSVAAGIKLDRLHNLPFYERFLQTATGTSIQRLALQTGLDARRELFEVLYVEGGGIRLAFWRGRFGGSFGREPRLKVEGATTEEYRGFRITGRQDYALMFFNTSVVATGGRAALRALIETQNSGAYAPPRKLIELTRQLPPDAQFWAVGLAAQGPQPPDRDRRDLLGPLLPRPLYWSAAAAADSNLRIQIRAIYESPEQAQGALSAYADPTSTRSAPAGLANLNQLLREAIGKADITRIENELDIKSQVSLEVFDRLCQAWRESP